ncbi:M56 family peptidase [Streptomyces sp. NPDC051636]|uniref:M56 family peptidase n=1 Tax=Streptomyces sp. NPDC051636 TaxID=3365663 RepID=UPI0037B0C977
MKVDVYTPLLLSLPLPLVSPVIGGRPAPALAARVLTSAAVLTAAVTTWSLVLLVTALLGDPLPVVAQAREDGHRVTDPVPGVVGVAACVALAVVARRVHRAARAGRGTRRARHTAGAAAAVRGTSRGHRADRRRLRRAAGVRDSGPARAGSWSPRPLLGALGPAERRVLLAHERAHPAHRHGSLVTASTLAAAANPLLVPVRSTVTFLVERWADEQAATAVGDRDTAARALARAALTAGSARTGCALTFTDRAVTRRTAALQTGPPPYLWTAAAAVLALGALPALGAADATGDLAGLPAGVLS